MSITFWAPEAPQGVESYDCDCNEWTEDGETDPNCHFCKGAGKIEFPISEGEFNVSNTNGMLIQKWIGFAQYPGDVSEAVYNGKIPTEKLQILQRRIKELQEDPPRARITGSMFFGTFDDRVVSYLRRMGELVETAIEHNSPICWG
ncbi:MAG: hypothetical protein GF334_08260 [Candidatus Altiarchaeales archaeon]|nr:hypothetical protein [Candidatus Altiarchaeales archaeon]